MLKNKSILLLVLSTLIYLGAFQQFALLTVFASIVFGVLFYEDFHQFNKERNLEVKLTQLENKITDLQQKNQSMSLAIGLRK